MLATFRGGGLGGGTVDSLLGFKSISRDERRAAADPYGLNPPAKRCASSPVTSSPATHRRPLLLLCEADR
jgi:hypothetical protein